MHEDLGSLSRLSRVLQARIAAESKTALRSALTAQCPPQLRLPGLPDVPIVETRWFTKDEIRDIEATEYHLPPPDSMARQLMTAWVEGYD